MSIQHAAIELLEHTAKSLNGLAEDAVQPGGCRYAAAKLAKAASRLRVEPLRPEDVRESFDILAMAGPTLQTLKGGSHPPVVRGWVDAVCYTYNASIDLLSALEAFHKHVTLDQVATARPMGSVLRRLLPAGWGGDRG